MFYKALFGFALTSWLPICIDNSLADPSSSSICDMPQYRGTAVYNKYCGSSGGGNNSNYDNGAAQRAQEAAAANAAAERQRAEEARTELERQRQAEEKRQQDAEFIRNRDAAANSLKGSSGSAISQLKGLSGTDNSGLKGSGFDSDTAGLKGLLDSDHIKDKVDLHPATDASVVDARDVPSGLDKGIENAIATAYPNAPSGVTDRVRKGFQAVMTHDWKVAKAWFEDALNHDPDNPGLKRLVVLSDYSQQHAESGKPLTDEDIPPDANPQTYAITSTKIHSQAAWMKFLFPDGKHLRKVEPVYKTLRDGRVVQLPQDSDMEFLFNLQKTSSAPSVQKATPTFIIGKNGKLIPVPENSDQKSPTYIKGKNGKLIEVPQPSDTQFLFPGNKPANAPKPTVESGKLNN
jgi:hypothetical protein